MFDNSMFTTEVSTSAAPFRLPPSLLPKTATRTPPFSAISHPVHLPCCNSMTRGPRHHPRLLSTAHPLSTCSLSISSLSASHESRPRHAVISE